MIMGIHPLSTPVIMLIIAGALGFIDMMWVVFGSVSMPYIPFMSADFLKQEMERSRRRFNGQIRLGLLAVFFCLLAVLTATIH